MAVYEGGLKSLLDVAILMYEEAAPRLFNESLLWNLGNAYQKRFSTSKEVSDVESAIKTMVELEKANPAHPDARALRRAGKRCAPWPAVRKRKMATTAIN